MPLHSLARHTPEEIQEMIKDKDPIKIRIALFFDGTMYTDDEMIRTGEGQKTARRMGHVAMTGTDGAIEGLRDVKARTRYFIHINNSNPVLNRASPERKAIEAQGWRIAQDGMRIDL